MKPQIDSGGLFDSLLVMPGFLRSVIVIFFVSLFLILLFPFESVAEGQQPRLYKVLKIVDGDTFDATDGNIRFRVRVAGMDTPERGSPFSKLATVLLKERIEGKNVQINSVGQGIDLYNRILGQVMVDGHDIGIEMIESGLATYYRPGCVDYPANMKKYDYDPRPYVVAEQGARLKKLYLWSDPSTTLPCKVRKQSRR